MHMTLSDRMAMNAGLIPVCDTVADIGCDHGKLSVYIIEKGIATKVIASDIGEGPLKRAKKTVMQAGLTDRIECRLADGAKGIKLDEDGRSEADVIVMAGIGGMLSVKIVSESPKIFGTCERFIIQAQSNIDTVRESMENMGYIIVDEDMVHEDGKYYTAISYRSGGAMAEKLTEEELLYGPVLIKKSHPILLDHLRDEEDKYRKIRISLIKEMHKSDKASDRITEVEDRIKLIKGLRDRMEGLWQD